MTQRSKGATTLTVGLHRQFNHKPRALAGAAALGTNGAAVAFDELLGNIEPEARAGGVDFVSVARTGELFK
jgi:hypothetical protein